MPLVTLRPSAGQATVEHVGLVVVVALVVALAVTVAVGDLRPSPRVAPRLVQAAAFPLRSAETPVGSVNPLLDLRRSSFPPGRDDEPIGLALRRIRREAAFAVSVREAFADGVRSRARERVEGALRVVVGTFRDPVGTVRSAGRGLDAVRHPLATARLTWDDAADYVSRLRGMPVRAAVLRVAHDAGEESVDAAISRGAASVRRAVLRRLRPRVPPRPPPPPGPTPGDRP